MRKNLFITLILLSGGLLLGLGAATNESVASMRAPDCSDGIPRADCEIWEVTVELSVPPSFSCTTGGDWQCAYGD